MKVFSAQCEPTHSLKAAKLMRAIFQKEAFDYKGYKDGFLLFSNLLFLRHHVKSPA